MKCKHCGADLKENSKFCSKCGQKVEAMEPAASKTPVHAPLPASPPSPKKKKGKGLLIVLLILILIGITAGGFIYYNFQNNKSLKASGGDQWERKDSEKPKNLDESTNDKESSMESSAESAEETQSAEESTTAVETLPTALTTTEAATPTTESASAHTYEIILKDCTWTEAFEDAKARGGYLVHIDNQDEYDYIRSNLLNTEASRKLKLWIGGVRIAGSYEYHWANADGTLSQNILNSDSFPGVWMSGEPSYRDNDLGQDEYYVNLFYYTNEKRWVWNDAPDDIIAAVNRYKGTVGYICEFE